MTTKKKRTAPPPIDRTALRAGFVDMPSDFFWSELMTRLGALGSETHLRHLLLDEWKWAEGTDRSRPVHIIRNGKCVGGRPERMYRKTTLGLVAALPPATMPR